MVMKSLAVVAAALPGILAQSSAPESGSSPSTLMPTPPPGQSGPPSPPWPPTSSFSPITITYTYAITHTSRRLNSTTTSQLALSSPASVSASALVEASTLGTEIITQVSGPAATGGAVKRLARRQGGIVLGTFHRPILDPPAFGQPCYECVVGTPAPGDMMTVFTTSTSGATPDPTPIFDFKLCATCPLTHTTVPVPGYTPGYCVGCIDDAAVPTSVPNPTTTPSPPGGGGPGMGGPWGGPWGPPGMGGGLQTVVTCPLTNTITTISWSTILSGGGAPVVTPCPVVTTTCPLVTATVIVPPGLCTTYTTTKNGQLTTCTEALPAWTPKIVVVGDTGAGGPPNLSGIVLPPGPGPYNSPPGGSAGGKMGSGCGSGFGCGSGAGNGNGTGPGNPKVKVSAAALQQSPLPGLTALFFMALALLF